MPVFTAPGNALATWPFAVPSPVMAETYPAICSAMARAFSPRGSMVGLASRYSPMPHAVAPAASGVFQDWMAFRSACPVGPSFDAHAASCGMAVTARAPLRPRMRLSSALSTALASPGDVAKPVSWP